MARTKVAVAETNPHRVALYVRVSTKEQAEEGQSIEAQLAALQRYCKDHGLQVVETFIDAGESARSDQRPEFQRMIATAKEKDHPFDMVLVHKLDRFARSTEDAAIYKALLRRDLGIQIVSISEPFDNSPAGRLTEHILDAIAEFYSANLANEVLKGMRQLAAKGKAIGKPPMGYRIGPDGFLTPDPEMAPIVQWMFQEYVSRRRSIPRIAQYLREEGVARFGPAAARFKWTTKTVRLVITNRTYLGEARWSIRSTKEEFVLPNSHPPLVPQEVFERAQEILQSHRAPRSKNGDYLLQGFGRCAHCGSAMIRERFRNGPKKIREQSDKAGRWREWLACAGYYHYLCPQRPFNAIRMNTLESAILQAVADLAQGNLSLSWDQVVWREKSDWQRQAKKIRQKLDQIQEKLQRQLLLFEEGLMTLEEYRSAKQRVEAERQSLETELAQIESALRQETIPMDVLQQVAANAYQFLADENTPISERRRVLSSILDHFVYDRAKDELRIVFRL